MGRLAELLLQLYCKMFQLLVKRLVVILNFCRAHVAPRPAGLVLVVFAFGLILLCSGGSFNPFEVGLLACGDSVARWCCCE